MTQIEKNQGNKGFKAKRATARYEIEIEAPPSEIFPLACPIEEYKWIEGWQCEMVYSDSGKAEPNCTFREDMSGPVLFNQALTITWFAASRNPETNWIQWILMAGPLAVLKLDVVFEESAPGRSMVKWSFILTTLSSEGNECTDETIQERMMTVLDFLGKSLKHYSETGRMLKGSEGQ